MLRHIVEPIGPRFFWVLGTGYWVLSVLSTQKTYSGRDAINPFKILPTS
jgi:hypothetical protein